MTALRHYYLCYSNLKYYKDFILLFVHPAPLSGSPAKVGGILLEIVYEQE